MSIQTTPTDGITGGKGRAMLSVDDVAEELNCSSRHVRRLADTGRMPKPVKLGSLIRWPRPVIQRWIDDGCPQIRRAAKMAPEINGGIGRFCSELSREETDRG
ncbi:MAG: helix-turn-helix transcriptional regulator [Rubripirellula sp.]